MGETWAELSHFDQDIVFSSNGGNDGKGKHNSSHWNLCLMEYSACKTRDFFKLSLYCCVQLIRFSLKCQVLRVTEI